MDDLGMAQSVGTVRPQTGKTIGAPSDHRTMLRALLPKTRRPVQTRFGVAALAASVVIAALPAAAGARTIVGTPGGDRLVGSSATGDLLFGGGGSDTLIGGAGNDVIYGVRGDNHINAGGGSNFVEGGAGSDVIVAANGANTIFGGTGHDDIRAGDGNNYVDAGGAPDKVTLGDGNNVLWTGSGGGEYVVGNGNNTIYTPGYAHIKAGSGVNHIWLSSMATVDCGGNPQTVLHMNAAADPDGKSVEFNLRRGRLSNCPNVEMFEGPRQQPAKIVRGYGAFKLVGTDGRDKLLGGHGGGSIHGGQGDDIIWADHIQETGGSRARARTTTITAGDGANLIYGGRGTNHITVGSGDNFIRGGAYVNRIATGGGNNVVRLQGHGRNSVVFNGGRNYVESFANTNTPSIRCNGGAKAIIIYGNTRPRTNCNTVASARSALGKRLQIAGTAHIVPSDPVVETPLLPGEQGIGAPRPAPEA